MSDDPVTLDVNGIAELLPHRYPFLLIDRITECIPGKSITAVKNVTVNEPFFQGHFPGNPVMPGVLILEAMAQAGGVLSHLTHAEMQPRPLYFLTGVDDARFRKPVGAGDVLTIDVQVERVRRGVWWYRCEASVEGKRVVSARIMCAEGGTQ
jgi:3-hydroxyacyl-[acyl-carrier-protein] dehydratase